MTDVKGMVFLIWAFAGCAMRKPSERGHGSWVKSAGTPLGTVGGVLAIGER